MVSQIVKNEDCNNSLLEHKVRLWMRSNVAISDELSIDLIRARINSSRAVHGFVLDNFP